MAGVIQNSPIAFPVNIKRGENMGEMETVVKAGDVQSAEIRLSQVSLQSDLSEESWNAVCLYCYSQHST